MKHVARVTSAQLIYDDETPGFVVLQVFEHIFIPFKYDEDNNRLADIEDKNITYYRRYNSEKQTFDWLKKTFFADKEKEETDANS